MNNKIKILITIVILIILIIIGIMYFSYNNINTINYKVIYSGYISDFNNIIISNTDEYNGFINNYNECDKEYKLKLSYSKYNNDYFKDKSLALIFITTGSSMNKFIGVDILCDANTLLVKPNINRAKGTLTDDITGKLILVEIDKSITRIEIKY